MKKITKVSFAIIMTVILLSMVPSKIVSASSRNFKCPQCKAVGVIDSITILYPNAWDGGHQKQWHTELHCKNSTNTHYWSDDQYQNQPHTLNGNTCIECGYTIH